MQGGQVAGCRLVVPGRGGTKSFEVVEEALHAVSEPVKAAVESLWLRATWVRMDDRQHPSSHYVFSNSIGVVARVGDEGRTLRMLEEFLGDGGFVLLPGS